MMVIAAIVIFVIGAFIIIRKNNVKLEKDLIKANGGLEKIYPDFCFYCLNSYSSESDIKLIKDTGKNLEFRRKVFDGNSLEGYITYGIEQIDSAKYLYCYATTINGFKTSNKSTDLSNYIKPQKYEPSPIEYDELVASLIFNLLLTNNDKLRFHDTFEENI